jgi:hypothetical protein
VNPIRYKQPAEIITLTFDYAPVLSVGATLTGSATVTAAAGLTVVGSTVASPLVNVQVSGGTLAATYAVSCRISDTLGNLHELDVEVGIRETALPVHPNAIVSLEALQRALLIESADQAPQLQTCLNIATSRAESLTGRILKNQAYTAKRYDGNGATLLRDVEWPITAITTVTVDEGSALTVWKPGDAGVPRDFEVLVHGAENRALYRSAGWPWGVYNIALTYTAGYVAFDADSTPPAWAVPYELESAIVLLAADEYYRRFRAQWNTASLNLQGQAVQYDPPQLFGLAMFRLGAYRRWAV